MHLVVELPPGDAVEVEPLQLHHQHGRHAPQLEPLAHVLVAEALGTHHVLHGLAAAGSRQQEVLTVMGSWGG